VGARLLDDEHWTTHASRAAQLRRRLDRGVELALSHVVAHPPRVARASVATKGKTQVGHTFVLVPGAGGAAWYWSRVVPLLERAGHRALAIDLPADDPRAGLRAYAKLVLAAIGKRRGVTLVAQSLGGFTAAVVAARAPKGVVERIVFVNAMIPVPGETAGDFWGDTGSEKARRAAAKRGGYDPEFDPFTYFLHDLPRRVVRELADHEREEAEISLSEPATFEKWPGLRAKGSASK
jgi:pimeloyl-ACP methyl ester carboxylesterase